MSNQSGTGKGCPSQDRALIKSRREVKLLEDSLRKKEVENEQLRRQIDHLKKENEKLREELTALRQPPKWAKANRPEEEAKKLKKKGPKFGHKPNPRTLPPFVDREVALVPKHCPDCNGKLPDPTKWHTHTQIDIPPPPRPRVTRYHVGWSFCKTCQKEVSIKNKLSGSKYGPNLHAQVCYWKFSLGLTLGKIQSLLKEQYQLELSTGLLAGMLTRSAKRFQGAYDDLATTLLSESHLHADETGWRNDGNNAWLWSFSNENISYYIIDRRRSQAVVQDVLGKSYHGILISDFYGGYNAIECRKQKCWAHILRDLRELKKKYPKDKEIQIYLNQMRQFYKKGVLLQKAHRAGKNIKKKFRKLIRDTNKFIFQNPSHSDLIRLMKRFRKYRHQLYLFVDSPIDGTNNAAEREIRPAVLMRKTSYGNRSDQGAEVQSIIMSMIRTAAKQGQNFTQLAAAYFCS